MHAVNKVKEELADGPFSECWLREHAEAVHQHAGGKRRASTKGARAAAKEKDKVELQQKSKFYFLNKHKECLSLIHI